MARGKINFFTEGIPFTLRARLKVRSWLQDTIKAEGQSTGELNFIFCGDDYLLNINRQYLDHDTYTDIITFDSSEEEGILSGDIFISVERVRENAAAFQISETDELHRVMVHGVLHLLGYGDKDPNEKAQMTAKEDHYLATRPA